MSESRFCPRFFKYREALSSMQDGFLALDCLPQGESGVSLLSVDFSRHDADRVGKIEASGIDGHGDAHGSRYVPFQQFPRKAGRFLSEHIELVRRRIGQVEVGSLEEIKEMSTTYLESLKNVRDKEGLSIAMLLVTDVFKEESILLNTQFDKEYKIPYERLDNGMYYLPGVLSRKKQLLPETLKVLED